MMKRIINLAFIFTLVFQCGFAQQGMRGQRMSPEERLNRIAEQLKLDDVQKKKVSAIYAVYDEKLSAFRGKMRNASDDERRDMFISMRAIHKEQTKEILEVLNDEQKVKYQAMQKERDEMMQKRRDERRRANPRNGAMRPGK